MGSIGIDTGSGVRHIQSIYSRFLDDPDVSSSYVLKTMSSFVKKDSVEDEWSIVPVELSLAAKGAAQEKLVEAYFDFMPGAKQSQDLFKDIVENSRILFGNGHGQMEACDTNCEVLLFAQAKHAPNELLIPLGMEVISECQKAGDLALLAKIKANKALPYVLRASASHALESGALPTRAEIEAKMPALRRFFYRAGAGRKSMQMAFKENGKPRTAAAPRQAACVQ
ncbi:Uncharacterised protein [uncultured archaeon]|nr:Uncharacterised protein [uncultured archaeon]